ncbi:MAG TPA: DUF1367 family protein [Aliidongia sp.]|uniref:DUF1367 family protein n=1 Tax=Aliidongia sp. TaxID=1914230 RepID=UPI002DDD3477|nr:DUF1367 family protein [Aliidongia sp.]HEV2674102.1 DUF1367 family protein [Aliidongia sp.]
METTLVMKRTEAGLIPVDGHASDLLAKVKIGDRVLVKLHRPRSVDQHRLFFALLTKVAGATEFETPEKLLVALKIALGFYDIMRMPNGSTVPVPNSISFASMPQDDFRRFFDQAVGLICQHLLSGMTADDLVAEVHQMLDQPRRVA